MLSLVEVPLAYFTEERGVSRPKAAILNAVIIAVIGILATLSVDKSSLLGSYTFLGRGFFDWFDYISSNILLPVGGLLIAIFIGYVVKKEDLKRELSNHGRLNIDGILNVYYFILRYVTPALLLIVFLNSVGVIKL
ncbi:hypothetical protein SDC9_161882 [bioreactor metagenome]|uniref:Sodium-dependent transporter n=1 Tax=bioreactor metagenome TaxID=1076179 RepID=A0A645FJH9_9ZZZZ